MAPEPASRACKTSSLAGDTDVLAWESSAYEVDGDSIGSKLSCCELSDVGVAGNIGPMFGEYCSAVGLDFAEGNGSHSGSLESEREAADAAEEVEDTHAHRSTCCSFMEGGKLLSAALIGKRPLRPSFHSTY